MPQNSADDGNYDDKDSESREHDMLQLPNAAKEVDLVDVTYDEKEWSLPSRSHCFNLDGLDELREGLGVLAITINHLHF